MYFKHGPKQPPKPLRKKVSERNFWKILSWGGKLGEKSSQLNRGADSVLRRVARSLFLAHLEISLLLQSQFTNLVNITIWLLEDTKDSTETLLCNPFHRKN